MTSNIVFSSFKNIIGNKERWSRVSNEGELWQDFQTLVTPCHGEISLNRIGSSVYLVIEDDHSDGLQAISYNTADYNVTSVAQTPYCGCFVVAHNGGFCQMNGESGTLYINVLFAGGGREFGRQCMHVFPVNQIWSAL